MKFVKNKVYKKNCFLFEKKKNKKFIYLSQNTKL